MEARTRNDWAVLRTGGGKMATVKYDVLCRRRRKVLNHARNLARSGEHADHQTIILHVAALGTSRLSDECSRIAPSAHSSISFAPGLERKLPELTSRPTRRGMHKLICEEFASPEMKRAA